MYILLVGFAPRKARRSPAFAPPRRRRSAFFLPVSARKAVGSGSALSAVVSAQFRSAAPSRVGRFPAGRAPAPRYRRFRAVRGAAPSEFCHSPTDTFLTKSIGSKNNGAKTSSQEKNKGGKKIREHQLTTLEKIRSFILTTKTRQQNGVAVTYFVDSQNKED